jgi:hypothetical protein
MDLEYFHPRSGDNTALYKPTRRNPILLTRYLGHTQALQSLRIIFETIKEARIGQGAYLILPDAI